MSVLFEVFKNMCNFVGSALSSSTSVFEIGSIQIEFDFIIQQKHFQSSYSYSFGWLKDLSVMITVFITFKLSYPRSRYSVRLS